MNLMSVRKPIDDPRLELAYKYPFLREAKALVSEANPGFEQKFLEQGRLRLEEALSERKIGFHQTNLAYLKYAYVMSYIYARMLVSALKSRGAVSRYVQAEARRASEALRGNSEEILMMAKELGTSLEARDGGYSIPFEKYLKYAPKRMEYALQLQELSSGKVSMPENITIGILRGAIREEISRNLPIPPKDLPKEVIEYSKKIKAPLSETPIPSPEGEKRYAWIAKLLTTPIPDVRHRVVNLVLAPYLVNIRKMGVEEATKVITAYIERCKELEPNTRINESYIRYQCKYAQSKGSRPLSPEKAKELLGSIIDLENLG